MVEPRMLAARATPGPRRHAGRKGVLAARMDLGRKHHDVAVFVGSVVAFDVFAHRKAEVAIQL